MKILFVNDNGTQAGGTEKYLFSLMTQLRKNHQVKLFSSKYLITNSDNSILNIINKIRYYSDQIYNYKSFLDMKKVLKIFKPDVVHIHNIDKRISASILPLFKGIPTIMTIHDLDLIYPGTEYLTTHDCKVTNRKYCNKCTTFNSYVLFRLKNLVRVPIIKKHINMFIAPSNYVQKIATRNLKINNIIQISHGINLLKYAPQKKTEQLLFVGRLERMKGIYPLIYAFEKIHKVRPNVKLVISGDGKEMNNLLGLVKKLKLKNIRFTGWLKNKNIVDMYNNSSIIIVPSICEESFGLVGMEAMSIGRPVIASNVGGIPEWLDEGKTGYLVNPGNSEQISEKVIQLLSNRKLLEQMGENSRKKAEQFSIEKHVNQIEMIYKELIKHKTN